MLLGTFFTLPGPLPHPANQAATGDPFPLRIGIRLNPGHEIYQGHFPGNPVVPGVCQIRMVTEILSAIFDRELQLVSADNIKFFTPVNPEVTPELSVNLLITQRPDNLISCTASIETNLNLCFKYKSIFK